MRHSLPEMLGFESAPFLLMTVHPSFKEQGLTDGFSWAAAHCLLQSKKRWGRYFGPMRECLLCIG